MKKELLGRVFVPTPSLSVSVFRFLFGFKHFVVLPRSPLKCVEAKAGVGGENALGRVACRC